MRDVRAAAMKGTNGIQAMNLIGRKLRHGGEAAFRLPDEVEAAWARLSCGADERAA